MPAEGASIHALVDAAVRHGFEWLRLLVEARGAVMIFLGVLIALRGFFAHWRTSPRGDFNPLRLMFARYLAMTLEFQLAADILLTAVSPSWDQPGKLVVVTVIRTALNFFLTREMHEERQGRAAGSSGPP